MRRLLLHSSFDRALSHAVLALAGVVDEVLGAVGAAALTLCAPGLPAHVMSDRVVVNVGFNHIHRRQQQQIPGTLTQSRGHAQNMTIPGKS